MKLVRLVAPVDDFVFRKAGKEYRCDANREVDVPEAMVRELLAEGFERVEVEAKATVPIQIVPVPGPPGASIQGEPGDKGDTGPRGKQGEIGPMPRHQWRDTELRFQMDVDQWGAWVDLQGPAGKSGGGIGGVGSSIFGAGPIDLSSLVPSTNQYFPAGWS